MSAQDTLSFKQRMQTFQERILEKMKPLEEGVFKNYITLLLEMVIQYCDDKKFNTPTLISFANPFKALKAKALKEAYSAFNAYELNSSIEHDILHNIKNIIFREVFPTMPEENHQFLMDFVENFMTKMVDFRIKFKDSRQPSLIESVSLIPSGPAGGSLQEINISPEQPQNSTKDILGQLYKDGEDYIQKNYEDKISAIESSLALLEVVYEKNSSNDFSILSDINPIPKILLSIKESINSTFEIVTQHTEILQAKIDEITAKQDAWIQYESKKHSKNIVYPCDNIKNASDIEYLRNAFQALINQEALDYDTLAEKLNLTDEEKTDWKKKTNIISRSSPTPASSSMTDQAKYYFKLAVDAGEKFITKDSFNQWLERKIDERIVDLEVQSTLVEEKFRLTSELLQTNFFLLRIAPNKNKTNSLIETTHKIIQTNELKENWQTIIININKIIKDATKLVNQIFDYFTGRHKERMQVVSQLQNMLTVLNSEELTEKLKNQNTENLEKITGLVKSIHLEGANKTTCEAVAKNIAEIEAIISPATAAEEQTHTAPVPTMTS